MTDNFRIITSKVKAIFDGLMKELTKASSKRIRCMEKEYSLGPMAEFTLANLSKADKKDKVTFSGLMVESIQVDGKTENNTEQEFTVLQKVILKRVYG